MKLRSSTQRTVRARDAFFLGALLALFALAPAILPYGGRYVTRGDYIEQQLPMILETRRILRAGLNAYSFTTYLGTPAMGSYAFYTLGSPFVWPLALLPKTLIPYGISVMAVLKHAVCALCAFLYFNQMLRDKRLSLLGSVLYTFSSFTVVNTQFYHFTEVIAFFPLILLGLEIAMSDHPRAGLLALLCGLNTLVNFYFMFSSALLAALYFLFRFFSEDWKRARSLRRVFFTVFECGIGCALAGILLIPALYFMITITRTGGGTLPLTQTFSLSTLFERLRVLLMPIESGVVHAFFGGAGSWCSTAAYLPVFGLTGALVFAFAQKKQNWLKCLLALLLLASALPILSGAFALYTNVRYTRWWYGLSLLLSLAALYALRAHPLFDDPDNPPETLSSRRPWLYAFALCSLLVCALILPALLPEAFLRRAVQLPVLGKLARLLLSFRGGAYAPDVFRFAALALALLGGGALLLILLHKMRFACVLTLVGLCACVQYGGYIAVGDQHLLSGGSLPGQGVYRLCEIAEPTLDALAMPEPKAFKRVDYGMRLRNYGMLRGYSSLTYFFSLRSSYIGRFIDVSQYGNSESTTITVPSTDPAVYALLSVTEYHQFDGEDVPEGFVYSREENGFPVYTNPNAVPMGFLQTTITGNYAQPMNEQTVSKTMLAAATLSDSDLERFADRLTRLDVHHIPAWDESAARLRQNSCDSFVTNGSGFTAHIDAKEAGLLVFTIPFDKGFSATVDGESAEILLTDLSFMSVFVESGEHEIVFTYRTRGLTLGVVMSVASVLTLMGYVFLVKKRPRLLKGG